jgi:hypothetical protein
MMLDLLIQLQCCSSISFSAAAPSASVLQLHHLKLKFACWVKYDVCYQDNVDPMHTVVSDPSSSIPALLLCDT